MREGFNKGALADAIRSYRKRNGFTLDQLAESAGVSRSMISQVESSKTVPTISVVCKLAGAMNTSVGALLGEGQLERIRVLNNRNDLLDDAARKEVCSIVDLDNDSCSRGVRLRAFRFNKAGSRRFDTYPCGSVGLLIVDEGDLVIESGAESINGGSGDIIEVELSRPFTLVQQRGGLSSGFLIISSS